MTPTPDTTGEPEARTMDIEDIGNHETLRKRLGLEANDAYRDAEIIAMHPFNRVRMLAAWHIGDSQWADNFAEWLKGQGIYLTTREDAEGIIRIDDIEEADL